MSRYGRKLTKQDLINAGITEITPEGRVFRGEVEINAYPNGAQNYLVISIYDRDENNNLIKIPRKDINSYTYKYRTLGLHRVMWAWFYGEVPEGMVIDHINNQHYDLKDYRLDNLQILTPAENLEKEKGESTKMLKCQMTKPREFYENKLNHYTVLYEKAKTDGDAEGAHAYRTSVANYKARLRYWDEHKEEYEKYLAEKEAVNAKKQLKNESIKDRKILAQYKQIFKEAGNKTMWHEVCKVEKRWDSLNSIQKEHVFEVLHKLFARYDIEEPKI